MTKKNRSDKQSEENPLEILAEHALYQYGLGNCVDLREYKKSLNDDAKAKNNPFDVLAKHAAEESNAGKTVTLEDFERKMKKKSCRESVTKSVRRLKNT